MAAWNRRLGMDCNCNKCKRERQEFNDAIACASIFSCLYLGGIAFLVYITWIYLIRIP